MAYVKLDQGILLSSIWSESPEIRVVWITLLAMSDQHGVVAASATGIAKMAGLPLETICAALEMFQAPDPHSRTPDDEGRRIARVDGGYVLLNHAKYREQIDKETRKEQVREAVARHKAKRGNQPVITANQGNQPLITANQGNPLRSDQLNSTQLTDSGDASRPGPKRSRKLPVESASAVKEACEDWTELLGGTAPGSRIAGAWPALLRLAPWSDVRPVWRWYLAEGKSAGRAEYCNPQDFASRLDYWRDRSQGLAVAPRGRQPVESAVEANARVLEAVEQGRL